MGELFTSQEHSEVVVLNKVIHWHLVEGDWRLGIRDWPISNLQSLIPLAECQLMTLCRIVWQISNEEGQVFQAVKHGVEEGVAIGGVFGGL